MDMEERLKTLFYNAMVLLFDEYEQYYSAKETREILVRALGTTEDELKQFGVDLTGEE